MLAPSPFFLPADPPADFPNREPNDGALERPADAEVLLLLLPKLDRPFLGLLELAALFPALSKVDDPADLKGLPDADLDGLPNADLEGLPYAGLDELPNVDLEGLPYACLDVLPNVDLEGLPGADLDVLPYVDLNGLLNAGLEGLPFAGLEGLSEADLDVLPNAGLEGLPEAAPAGRPELAGRLPLAAAAGAVRRADEEDSNLAAPLTPLFWLAFFSLKRRCKVSAFGLQDSLSTLHPVPMHCE